MMTKRCSIVSTTCLSPSQATDMGPCKSSDRVPCWMARKVARLLERRMIKNESYDRKKTPQCNTVRSWNVPIHIYICTYMFSYISIYIYVCTYIVFPHTHMISKRRNEVRRGPSPTSKHIHNICLKQEPDVMRRTPMK